MVPLVLKDVAAAVGSRIVLLEARWKRIDLLQGALELGSQIFLNKSNVTRPVGSLTLNIH